MKKLIFGVNELSLSEARKVMGVMSELPTCIFLVIFSAYYFV